MSYSNIPPPKDSTPKHHQPQRDCIDRPYVKRKYDREASFCDQDKYDRIENLFEHRQVNKSPPADIDQSKKNETITRNPFGDDDYFSQINEEETAIPTVNTIQHDNDTDKQDDDEDDPLDAYMKSLDSLTAGDKEQAQYKQSSTTEDEHEVSIVYSSRRAVKSKTVNKSSLQDRGVRLDIDEDDNSEAVYINQYKQRPISEEDASSQDEYHDQQHDVDYDDEDNIVSVRRMKKDIEPLIAVDHSTIHYDKFVKNFYTEHPEIAKLTVDQSEVLRTKLEIKVTGQEAPKPVCSFAHFNFDEQLMKVIRRSDYVQPTPIQAQAIPAALSGRNIIGIAQTGSGKTAAYLWPMIEHIMGQPDLKQGDGPIGLVLVPTRELALQVYGQAKKFSNSYNIAVVCAYGGGSKYEQSQDLAAGAEIVVATPGRLMDLIKLKATNLRRVTYFVLDEADRFFDMGFEEQVTSICQQVRPDRQTLFFSATFKHKTEHLASRFLENPIKIVQKKLGEVNEDVTQHVITFDEGTKKLDWLLAHLVKFTSTGSVIIFVTRITKSEELHKNLEEQAKETLILHGDMEQVERNRVISSFKRKEKDILIATDVAARGLDISHIRTVINYDVARDIDTHIHRIGRTGRAGTKGDAYTLITDKDRDFAGHLVKNLETSNQIVSEDLIRIAMQSHAFRKSRSKQKPRYGQDSKNQSNQWNHMNDGPSSKHDHQNRNNEFSNHRISGNKYKHHKDQRYQGESGPSSSHEHTNSSRKFDDDRKRGRWT